MKPSQDKERLVTACEIAEDMFWNTIASQYPEVKSGDFPPAIAIEMADKLTQFVTVWLKMNEPQNMGTVEVLLHTVDYEFGERESSDLQIEDFIESIHYQISNNRSDGVLRDGDFIVGEWEIRR